MWVSYLVKRTGYSAGMGGRGPSGPDPLIARTALSDRTDMFCQMPEFVVEVVAEGPRVGELFGELLLSRRLAQPQILMSQSIGGCCLNEFV